MPPQKPAAPDLSNCDTWPVHTPDAIQPFGYLIAVDTRPHITHWSDNLPRFAALAAGEAFPLTELFSDESARALKGLDAARVNAPMRVSLRTGKELHAVAHPIQHGTMIVELEEIERESPQDLIQQQEAVSQFASCLEALRTSSAVCDAATHAVKDLTGYDRVMIYRFHEDLHGEVIAEARAADLESWLGLHYPATDIPAPARAVFAASKLRMIPDVDYRPVPIVGGKGHSGSLDLTRSLLRSVSPIHVEYLHNMRVTASLTLSIKHGERLWGLVACHHYRGPRRPTTSLRAACAIIADYLSAAIALKTEQETLNFRRSKTAIEEALRRQMVEAESMGRGLCTGETNILQLMSDECRGAAVIRGTTVQCIGQTPEPARLQELVSWLRGRTNEPLYATDRLSDELPAARAFAASASGLLALMPAAAAETAILWFKPETITTVKWGGNPEKAAEVSGMRLHPRKSFDAWVQTVRGRSLPWHPWEIEVASSFLLTLTAEELRRRVASESRARAEAESANRTMQEFMGVISHDLRDPLSSLNLSLLLLKKLLPPDSRASAGPTLGSMERAVAQMTELVRSLLDISAIDAGGLKLNRQAVSASEVLHDCVDILAPIAAEKGIDLSLKVPSQPPVVQADRNQLLQVCSNLIGNALKFTPEAGRVEVSLQQSDADVKVEVADSGPGISADDVPHIFDRFYRARTAKTRGVGLGLAIARGVVEAHGGTIGVRSEQGKGATFWFVIPKK